MRKEFLINIGFLTAINLIIKPLYIFGIDIKVQNTVGTATYGLYAALLSLAYLLQIFNDAGIQQYNNQATASNRTSLPDRYPALFQLKMYLAVLYIILIGATAYFLGYTRNLFPLLLHIAFNQLLVSWLLFQRSMVSGLGYYRKDSFLSVLDKALMIIICGILLYAPVTSAQFKIEWLVWAQTLSLIVPMILAQGWLRHARLPVMQWVTFRDLRPIIRQSLPFTLVVLLMTGYTRLDTLLLERLRPDGSVQAGIYYMGYRLLDALNNFAFLFGALLLPMLSNMLSAKVNIQPLVTLSTRLLTAGSVAVAVAVSKYAENIIDWLYIAHVQEASFIFRILIWVFVAVCLMYVYGTLLTAAAKLKAMNSILALALVVNVVLLVWWIPLQGARGAAFATLITQFFVTGGLIGLVFRYIPIRFPAWEVVRMGVFFSICALFLFIPIPTVSVWQFNFAGVLFGCLLGAFVAGLTPFKELMHWWRQRNAT